jgi:hypothetical protein
VNCAISNAILADPTMEARIANFGYTAFASSPAGFGKFIAEDIEKMGRARMPLRDFLVSALFSVQPQAPAAHQGVLRG